MATSCVGNSDAPSSSDLVSSDSVSVTDALNLGDADYFSQFTVAELKQRLKNRGLSVKGKKLELVDRLVSSLNSPSCKCKCGVQSVGQPMVQCDKCYFWSHCTCYNLSVEQAQSIAFQCELCVSPSIGRVETVTLGVAFDNPADSDNSVCSAKLVSEIKDIRAQLSKFTKLFNGHLLLIKDEMSHLHHQVSTVLSSRLSFIEEQVGKLSQVPSKMSSYRRSSNTGFPNSLSRNHGAKSKSVPFSQSHSSDKVLLSLTGVDSSNSITVIGRLIEGLYLNGGLSIPAFSLSLDMTNNYHIPVFSLEISRKDLDLFLQLWRSGVRSDVGFILSPLPNVPVSSAVFSELPPSSSSAVAPSVPVNVSLLNSPHEVVTSDFPGPSDLLEASSQISTPQLMDSGVMRAPLLETTNALLVNANFSLHSPCHLLPASSNVNPPLVPPVSVASSCLEVSTRFTPLHSDKSMFSDDNSSLSTPIFNKDNDLNYPPRYRAYPTIDTPGHIIQK